MRKYFFLLVIFSSGILIGQEAVMSVSEIASFKDQVSNSSKTTTTIVSDFVQYKHMDFLANDIETSGKLAFKAPGLVKWEYTSPYQYSVIFKEDKLLINDGGTKSNVDIGSSKMFMAFAIELKGSSSPRRLSSLRNWRVTSKSPDAIFSML